MFSTLVCIAVLAVMAYFAFACLYEVHLWISTRLSEFRQQRRSLKSV
jgi:Tfp pilus assembly protein FimT